MVGLFLFVTGVAHAGPPALSPKPSESAESSGSSVPEYDDYRLTLLLSDATAISLLLGTAAVSENEAIATGFVVAGLGTYALGGPIIHFAHQQPARGFTSLGLRVGLPGAGILVGTGLLLGCPPNDEGWCAVGAVIFGGVIAVGGALTAMIIDDSMLGRAPRNPPKDTARRTNTFRAGFASLFDPRKKALGVSLVGDF
jgi:hypothetical protein